jgi:hypothetical protein
MSPRAGLDDVEKRKISPPPGLELRPLGRPTLSHSLYRLSYPGSQKTVNPAYSYIYRYCTSNSLVSGVVKITHGPYDLPLCLVCRDELKMSAVT